MSDPVVRWHELSPDLMDAFQWAHATERENIVGTRALLIGMIRVGEGAGEPEQLLKVIARPLEALYTALQSPPHLPPMNPHVSVPTDLKAMPRITPNVERALRLALELRREAYSNTPLNATLVFGALLALPESTAYQGLAILLDGLGPVPEVHRIYLQYLRDPDESSFEDHLRNSRFGERTPQAASPSQRVDWQSDGPAQFDQLGRKHLAATLVTRLRRMSQENPDDSFMLHVDGTWGAGKSTLLGFIEEALGEEWMIVKFDAWRQSRVGPPWWALLTSLRKAMSDTVNLSGRWRLRAGDALERIQRDHISVTPFVLLFVLAAALFAITRPASTEVRSAAGLVSATVAAFTLLWTAGRAVAQFFMWESAAGARLYERSNRDPMEVLATHFAWLISRSRRHVIFFIDDLDRCNENYVVDLLDSIQTLVRHTPGQRTSGLKPYFIVAADGRWIRRSYERVYAAFDDVVTEPGRPLGYLFLDKIFQLTVQVPAVGTNQQAEYLKALLSRVDEPASRDVESELAIRRALIGESDDQATILSVVNNANPAIWSDLAAAALERLSEPDIEQTVEHDLQRFTYLLERNPRSIKRFLNAFSMALATALLEGRELHPDPLALWTILRLRWPELADHLCNHPSDIDILADSNQVDPTHGWIAQLSTAEELRDVARFGDGVLSSDAIRLLTGTERLNPRACRRD